MIWLDEYERRCRLAPGLLALIPVAVVITAVGVRTAPVVSGALSLICLAGGPVLLAAYVRSRGLAAQKELWTAWGGPPTTRALRTRETATNPVRRDAWRSAIEAVTKMPLLSPSAEDADPVRADDTIEVAVDRLRELTRTEAFPLVAAEHRNYGFERNFYGMRASGRLIALISVIAVGVVVAVRAAGTIHPAMPVPFILGAAIDLLVLIGWLVLPSERRTRTTADKYAHQLLQGAVTLAHAPPPEAPGEAAGASPPGSA
jgi:hypothetical protein